MSEIRGESFDESWVSDDGFDDISQPDKHPYSTAHLMIYLSQTGIPIAQPTVVL